MLLQRNARVNCQNDRHMTALHYATTNKHLDIVRLLLNFGATAYSNRDFRQKRIFNQPDWGPASIRKIKARPATAPTVGLGSGQHNYRQTLGESFSSASRVPPERLQVDDLSMMSESTCQQRLAWACDCCHDSDGCCEQAGGRRTSAGLR